MKCQECRTAVAEPGIEKCMPCLMARVDDYLAQGPMFQAAVRAEVARQFAEVFSDILGRPATAGDIAAVVSLTT